MPTGLSLQAVFGATPPAVPVAQKERERIPGIHLESRKVDVAEVTVHPNEQWIQQIARNVTMEGWGFMGNCRYLLHDRDSKYTASFRAIVKAGGLTPVALPPRSPNLNARSERWVRSVKEGCLSKLILYGERSLRRALIEYVAHYHQERHHQGKNNVLLFPQVRASRLTDSVQCRERLGGLLRYYNRESAWRGTASLCDE